MLRQKAGQKRGQMIPQLQRMLGAPGVAPEPVDAVPEAAEFALLMQELSEPPPVVDGAAMMAFVVQPLPVLPERAPDPRPGGIPADVQVTSEAPTQAVALPLANGVETQIEGPPEQEKTPALAPDFAAHPTPPKQAGGTDPEQQNWVSAHSHPDSLTPEVQQGVAEPAPKSAVTSAGERAFLARIEPQTEPNLPDLLADSNAPASVTAIVAPLPKPGTVQASVKPKSESEPLAAPDAKAERPAPNGDAPPWYIIEGGPKPVALKVPPIDLTILAQTDPQMIAQPRVDGPTLGTALVDSQPVTASMPDSVPATLIARAPEAALGPVEVVLNPEELGKIRFEIHQKGDQLRVFLAVERPETLDLLRRHADQLVQEFRAAGFAGATFSFGQWGGQQGQKSGESTTPEPNFSAAESPQKSPLAAVSRNLVPSQGLNLRL